MTVIETPLWEQRAAQKRAARDSLVSKWQPGPMPPLRPDETYVKDFPNRCGLLTDEQLTITETPPSQLLSHLSSGYWSAESVTRAFIARATIAHYLTNPLAEVLFDRAVARAQELDHILSTTGTPLGPLHGLPISLKDVLNITDTETTLGFVARIGHIPAQEDRLVTKLHNAGAVLYCKTNVPQTLMSGECVNFVFGRTSTPHNTRLTAGGSSGGEGSLIALGGSPLGIGSDIAGSIRTPANFNGIFGICPSAGRFPAHSAVNADGMMTIQGVAGPLSRSVDGLEVYTRALLGLRPWEWDFSSVRMPWREEEYCEGRGERHPLCFAFMPHDCVVLPNPPIRRGMQVLKQALVSAGHQVIDIDPWDGQELMDAAFPTFFASGGEEVKTLLGVLDEPLIDEVTPLNSMTTLSVSQYRATAVKVKMLREKYLDIWQATAARTATGLPVDAVILPSGGTVAPPHGKMEYFTYEAISNVLDWTCATVPVSTVDPVLDVRTEDLFEPMSEYDRRNWDSYTPEKYKDAPVCLQVMGRRFEEEKVLGLLQTVNRALGRDELYMA
ncbi:alpha-glucosidase [Aspergillus costaricaensis CBS 115574]|uniref:Alpha-glucosidase n=1 Tax=Aspergillus costaricaensis CBS 115574 TaxID=1448317 RepID=A0ACD1I1P0_9EURO|nr:alpha-glucosidase [Aspergillus costaricaensis CBS 115574]RAK84389.1 alpha-glucosidase [Aspergillus costaricaensis CBS 115574]